MEAYDVPLVDFIRSLPSSSLNNICGAVSLKLPYSYSTMIYVKRKQNKTQHNHNHKDKESDTPHTTGQCSSVVSKIRRKITPHEPTIDDRRSIDGDYLNTKPGPRTALAENRGDGAMTEIIHDGSRFLCSC
eukprot:scaffold11360_cov75-Cyclotella_meneghiniana.AAC.4